ncbi:hypothetical protein AWW66_10920 [Micromonospora rosaria]|uniref:Flavin reductase n=1 Tax=Micromonospora rosaria TaxID=47874 RepID=A0A136PU88_9ACTN|nr:hypothetical protein [Micromonospora rosaria]KXK61945.1 hypothetical protein AWW66_10920 [Micromonospora rosaria]
MVDEHGPTPDAPAVMRTLARIAGIGRHLPDRPSWRCAAPDCPDPWPCPHARVKLTADACGDRILLSITMAEVLNVAVADLIDVPGDHDLFRRLLAWTR